MNRPRFNGPLRLVQTGSMNARRPMREVARAILTAYPVIEAGEDETAPETLFLLETAL